MRDMKAVDVDLHDDSYKEYSTDNISGKLNAVQPVLLDAD